MTQNLAFSEYREKERTKHVHRLHPYKGKFIPQLVEYFLDEHTDDLKRDTWFRAGDVILDPFCGSGTTLVQAGELGIHAIGVDISEFNTLLANIKVSRPDLNQLYITARRLVHLLKEFNAGAAYLEFDVAVGEALSRFNKKYQFSNGHNKAPEDFGRLVSNFMEDWNYLRAKYDVKLRQEQDDSFLSFWYAEPIRKEIEFLHREITSIPDTSIRDVMSLALSRTLRSCRATTHADLATLKSPVFEPYYCRKHRRICKPLLTATKWWERYALDCVSRIAAYRQLRTPTHQICITDDARTTCLDTAVRSTDNGLAQIMEQQRIRGIFSSPPYVGLIDYHEQHAYAYELFGLARRDEWEIGAKFNGQGRQAREDYVDAIVKVLRNCKRYLADDYDVFLVANDKWDLYPSIAQGSGMQIVKRYERPVLFRTEKNRNTPYRETIFHLKGES